MAKQRIDRYADGITVSPIRLQKAEILAETITGLYPDNSKLLITDFGCADGAIPVKLLNSSIGDRISFITGITLLNYNDIPDKSGHIHPRFNRVIANLDKQIEDVELPWGQCDIVIATAFFHYLKNPEIAFSTAARLLKPTGGYLIAGMPSPWVLALRKRGVTGIMPPNNYIHTILSLDNWKLIAETAGLHEIKRQAVQWLGCNATVGIERWLRRNRLLTGFGGNYFVIYKK